MKIALKGLLLAGTFVVLWLAIAQINWVKIFHVKQAKKSTEEKLGDALWDFYKTSMEEERNPVVRKALDTLVTHYCDANNLKREYIKVHVLQNNEINAFALPNGHLVVFTGLLAEVENQEELSGVLCHEIAHIQLNHVMKKLIKEVGLSTLISMATGTKGVGATRELAKTISSSAFDRSLEKDADLKSVEYMAKAEVNPAPFAEFMYKLSSNENLDLNNYLSWMSTHPASEDRAAYIMDYASEFKGDYHSVLSDATWQKVQRLVGKEEE